MITRYRVKLGIIQMDSLDDDLAILDVEHSAPDFQIDENRTANADGYDYGEEYFKKTTVTVRFELHIYDIERRNEICQKINTWARAGGVLTVNDRKGQQLMNVRCAKFASVDSVRDWTKPLTIVFETTGCPFWQSEEESALDLAGTTPKGTLKLDGNTGKALVSVTATAQAAVTKFKISVGDTVIELKDLSVATGQTIVIDYVRNRYLMIRANGKSVLMQPNSSDVLSATCGASSGVQINANGRVNATVKARGLWL